MGAYYAAFHVHMLFQELWNHEAVQPAERVERIVSCTIQQVGK